MTMFVLCAVEPGHVDACVGAMARRAAYAGATLASVLVVDFFPLFFLIFFVVVVVAVAAVVAIFFSSLVVVVQWHARRQP